LIRKKYTFRPPEFDKLRYHHANYDDENEANFMSSMVFDGSDIRDIKNMQGLRENEQAIMKSKDITSSYKTKKHMFDQLNSKIDVSEYENNESGKKGEGFNEDLIDTAPSTTAVTLTDATHRSNFQNKTFKYQITKCLEDVLTSSIAPSDWRKECQRVEKKLVIPINKEVSDYHSR